MLDINLIRNNPDLVKRGIFLKKSDSQIVDDFLILDNEWRKLIKETDDLKAEQKKLSEERKIEEAKKIKNKIQDLEVDLKSVEKRREEILFLFPNLPFEEVPVGKNEKENVVIREVGNKSKFFASGGFASNENFHPKDYLELGQKLDLIDIERAVKVSGSRFGYLKNQAALLEFALIKMAFDKLISKNFIPVIPPVMIKSEMMKGMGYVDSGKDSAERYFLEKDDLYLVGTSEQSIGPMHADEIFNEEELPKRYLAFSPCFRREAGSYGKDTKGILRVHQFDKLEMFSFCHPEKSKEEHKLFIEIEEELMKELRIPYRVVQLCTGDLSHPSASTVDIETWLPGQNNGQGEYRETHSASNTTDFQARRLNIKYKSRISEAKGHKSDYVHTINGTAFAIGRILIAIIENYQQKDGSILIPEVLQKYLNFKKII